MIAVSGRMVARGGRAVSNRIATRPGGFAGARQHRRRDRCETRSRAQWRPWRAQAEKAHRCSLRRTPCGAITMVRDHRIQRSFLISVHHPHVVGELWGCLVLDPDKAFVGRE